MYQSPIGAHGFNHQSFYRQPVSNLRQINEVVWDRNNETQQTGGAMPHAYASIPYQQYVSEYANLGEQVYSALKNPKEVIIHSTKAVINNHENSLPRHLSQTAQTDYPSTQQSRPIETTSSTNKNRLLSRQSSLGDIPETKNTRSQGTVPLSNSRSVGSVHDYIQRERRVHTMAPLTRILGPSSTLQANMFASTTTPSEAQTMKLSHLTQIMPNRTFNSWSQSDAQTTDVVDDTNREEDADYDDDDTPIIVKVRYDPDAGGPPSEDIIRQALDNQLKGQSNPKMTKDPIVLNFLNHPTQPQISQMGIRPQQPVFNRSIPPAPQLMTRPHHRIPIPPQQQLQQQSLQSLQQRQRQYQQFLQQKSLQQQQLQLQENQRRQPEILLQQQKQNQQLQQFLQEQPQRDQQREQQQTKLEQHQTQQQLKAEQQHTQQLIQQQLQLERQRQQQQRYRQLLQQQQLQKQQELQQRGQQIYQQQEHEQKQQYSSLPPMAPRPSRTGPSIRPTPMNQPPNIFHQNKNMHLVQSFPPAPMPLRNSQQISTINIQKLPNQNINSTSTGNPLPTGLNAYNSSSHKYAPNMFMPIQFEGFTEQQFAPINNTNIPNVPQNLLQRPHTAPLSIDMFRPPSALDIPELSKENLSSMLDQLPGLHGRRFSIEYAQPTEPISYPTLSQLDGTNAKYHEPVANNQLPNNVIQHVRNSNNLEIRTALDRTVQPDEKVQSTAQSQPTSSKLKNPPSKLLHHRAQSKHKVKKSRLDTSDDCDSTTTQTSTSDEETSAEKIEIVPLSKH